MMGHAEMMGEKNPHPGVAEMSDEQKADYAALRAGVGEEVVDTGGAVSPGGDLASELTGAILLLVACAAPAFPCLPGIYTQETTEKASAVIAALCRKHGWLQGGLAQGHGEEMAAAIVLLPLAYVTYTGIRGDLDAKKPVTVPATEKMQVLGGGVQSGHCGSGADKGVSFGNVVPGGENG